METVKVETSTGSRDCSHMLKFWVTNQPIRFYEWMIPPINDSWAKKAQLFFDMDLVS